MPENARSATRGLAPPELQRGLAALDRGRVPVLSWDDDHSWLITRPRSGAEASDLIGLQQLRGIRAVRFKPVRGDEPPRCVNPDCRDFPGRHWHDGDKPRYFRREGDS